jgi:transcriptional regulator with XRE-family HTH domain
MQPMPTDTFNKRFKELVKGLTDTELGAIIGVTADTARKMRNGDIQSLKLQSALRLARNLNISPWYLGGESDPSGSPTKSSLAPKSRKAAATHTQTVESSPTRDQMLILQEEVVELRARIRRLEKAIPKL